MCVLSFQSKVVCVCFEFSVRSSVCVLSFQSEVVCVF